MSAGLARLDQLLRSREPGDDTGELIKLIAQQELWPGLRRPADVPAYLQSISGDAADLVVASFLILLQRDGSALDDMAWRPLASELLAKNLDRLEPYVQKPRERGAHAIFAACAGAVPAIEGDLRAEIRQFADVRKAKRLRNGVLRRVNGSAGTLVLRPFVPAGDSDRDLQALLEVVAGLESSDAEVADARFVELKSAATRCRVTAEALGTSFARMVLGETAEAVLRVATRTNELIKPPATLEASVSQRPLPLQEPGVTCEVGLEIRNTSEVRASQIAVRLQIDGESAVLGDTVISIDSLDANSSIPLSTTLSVLRASTGQAFSMELSWRNPDHSAGSARVVGRLEAQAADVDWDVASALEPFAAYPVEEARQLVGRGQLLRQLSLRFRQLPLSNIYVTGQRRVGKTSLVRVLMHELEAQDETLIVASVEMGEVRRDDGRETIGELGRALAKKIIRRADAAGAVDIPEFESTLAPLNGLVEDLRDLDRRFKFVFVVDEFDELPDDMFKRSGPGDAMFLPIRSLAQKPFVGWILIGGERMPFIRDEQAARLNTFSAVPVDYLEYVEPGAIAGSVGSFDSLVEDPLPPGFKVSTDGVARIHALTLGNPHFAKELCAVMYQDAVRRRDPLIEQRDVENAATILAGRSDFELFAHFWEDGVFSTRTEERRRIELERRHYLVAMAEARRGGRGTPEAVERLAEGHGLSRAAASRTRLDLISRGVLQEALGNMAARVPLFGSWLEDEGVYKLAPRGIAEREDEAFRTADMAAQVSSAEVGRLISRWRGFRFRGEAITQEAVVRWLQQFSNDSERRLMFRLLERFKVVTEAELVAGLRQVHRLVGRETTVDFDQGQRSFNHVLVAGMGRAGSSGQAMAYKYRQANNIRQRNLVALEDLPAKCTDDVIKAVVLVDDVIGTGGTAKAVLDRLAKDVIEGIDIYVFAVTGVPEALARLENAPSARGLGVSVDVSLPLLDQQRPFVPDSPVFGSPEEQTAAREIAASYGQRLAPSLPLGYKNQAILMTLPDNCPNNAPPIFWSDADGWTPLFPRTAR